MSEFHVNVVKLGPMVSHPNADTLNITKVYDYPVITKKNGFKEGDLVVYVPVDSVVPDTEEWHFLCPLDSDGKPRFPVGQVPEKYRVIEAKKIRGIFSQGMLAPLPKLPVKQWKVGEDARQALSITKYEPPVPSSMNGECESAPKGWVFPVYTDVEGIKRYPNVLIPGEMVVVTEKIHGCVSAETMLETLEIGECSIEQIVKRVRSGEVIHVLSHDHSSNEDVFNLVEDVSILETETNTNWYNLELEDGNRLLVTGDHLIYIPELHAYRCVKDLSSREKVHIKK
jgi:tRNA-binding EMAP/Myf-like protein